MQGTCVYAQVCPMSSPLSKWTMLAKGYYLYAQGQTVYAGLYWRLSLCCPVWFLFFSPEPFLFLVIGVKGLCWTGSHHLAKEG